MKRISFVRGLIRLAKAAPFVYPNLKGASKELDTKRGVIEGVSIIHPKYQLAKLIKKDKLTNDAYEFTFKSDNRLAPFKPGQYISIEYNINGISTTRPYSLTSTNSEAKEGIYKIIIKRNTITSSYMIDDVDLGKEFKITGPFGDFSYNSIRDSKNIIAIAGGSGITPFISMAKAIENKELDINLTIIYGNKTKDDIIARDYLDGLSCVEVINVIEDIDGYITLDLIKKCYDNSTIFICGSAGLYKYMHKILDDVYDNKHLRYEIMSPKPIDDNNTYNITLHYNNDIYNISTCNQTILEAIEASGFSALSRCRAGVCGYCHSKLIKGDVYIAGDDYRRHADLIYGYIHPCVTYAKGDIEIEVFGGNKDDKE